jgi:hypothetical protein
MTLLFGVPLVSAAASGDRAPWREQVGDDLGVGANASCVEAIYFPHVRDLAALDYWIPTFGAHRVPSLKTTLKMPPRTNQCLHPDEGTPQASDQNQLSFQKPPTQTLPTITEASEDQAFDSILELQLQL